MFNSEIRRTRPCLATVADELTGKGRQLGRESWTGLVLVESVRTGEDCSAKQPTYGTHMAFSTLISK